MESDFMFGPKKADSPPKWAQNGSSSRWKHSKNCKWCPGHSLTVSQLMQYLAFVILGHAYIAVLAKNPKSCGRVKRVTHQPSKNNNSNDNMKMTPLWYCLLPLCNAPSSKLVSVRFNFRDNGVRGGLFKRKLLRKENSLAPLEITNPLN